jgi:hypothetical protein
MQPAKIACEYPGITNPPPHSFVGTSPPPPPILVSSSSGAAAPGKPDKPVVLRRVSQSSPHLDIPHFMNAQEKGFNFHHILSGLIDKNTSSVDLNQKHKDLGASTELVACTDTKDMPSSPNLAAAPERKLSLDRNKSAAELTSVPHHNEPGGAGGLRKVASIANYNLVQREQQSHSSSSAASTPHSSSNHLSLLVHHHFGSYLTPNAQQHHNSFNPIPEDPQDTGLMMSVRPSGSLAANALTSSSTGARQGLMESASASMTSSASAAGAGASPPKSALGGVMGVFGRGFFAKPVHRSDEENYRYILALDRN